MPEVKRLELKQDFTRFINDPTFPYKVTVCIGDERILCSGVLLAQQSAVLEKKIREDEGVLMFDEMLEVENSHQTLHSCISFLHGAEVLYRMEEVHIVAKFASSYEIRGLFDLVCQKIDSDLCGGGPELAVSILKLSNSLIKYEDRERLLSFVKRFIRSNKDSFSRYILRHPSQLIGFDIITILSEKLPNGCGILRRWSSLSTENKNFVVRHCVKLDIPTLFGEESDFTDFISFLAEGVTSADDVRKLLDIQKSFLKSQTPSCIQLSPGTSTQIGNNVPPRTGQLGLELQEIAQSSIIGSTRDIRSDTYGESAVDDKSSVDTYSDESAVANSLKRSRPFTVDSGTNWHDEGVEDSDEESYENTSYKSSGEYYQESSVVYIGDIPPSAEESRIMQMFSGFGKINAFKIVYNRRRKGNCNFGFLTYKNISSANNLLRKVDQGKCYMYDEHVLKVRPRN